MSRKILITNVKQHVGERFALAFDPKEFPMKMVEDDLETKITGMVYHECSRILEIEVE